MRPSAHLGIVLLAALALAGCGRRGPVELPPGAPQAVGGPSAQASQERLQNNDDNPGLIQSPNRVIERTAAQKQQDVFSEGQVPRPINAPPEPKTGKGFVLDPLL